jgi:hypothetical protein
LQIRGEKYGYKAGFLMLAIEGFPFKIINASQPMVENTLLVNIKYYPVDECHPQIQLKYALIKH